MCWPQVVLRWKFPQVVVKANAGRPAQLSGGNGIELTGVKIEVCVSACALLLLASASWSVVMLVAASAPP